MEFIFLVAGKAKNVFPAVEAITGGKSQRGEIMIPVEPSFVPALSSARSRWKADYFNIS